MIKDLALGLIIGVVAALVVAVIVDTYVSSKDCLDRGGIVVRGLVKPVCIENQTGAVK